MKTKDLLIDASIAAFIIFVIFEVSLQFVHADFKVVVQIDGVDSFSGKHTIKVKTDLDHTKLIKPNLGKEADYQDESRIFYTFIFKHSPKEFRACLDSDCKKGFNSPAKRPEYVKFRVD